MNKIDLNFNSFCEADQYLYQQKVVNLKRIYIMIQRHYSPDQIAALNQSLQKQTNKRLREGGSASNLAMAKTTTSIKDDSEMIGHYLYRKRDEIGSGYTSRVYKCKNIENESQYAMKVIDLKRYSASSMDMLDNEIEILKKLNHPNIIRFENVYKTSTNCYLISQYCPNGDLLQYVTKNGKLCQKEAISIAYEIIQATKYLFKMGIVHRDLKPANIFKHSKTWKLGDFGFSINCTTEIKTRHNVGTPLYMPLESLLKNIYSPESDIFAVGVIIFEMMTGITPWECKTQKQLIRKMTSLPFNVPQKHKVSLPVKSLLEKLCSVNKQNRMSKEQFLELNIRNFNSLINFNQPIPQKEQRGRFFSVKNFIKQDPLKSKQSYKEYLKKGKKQVNERKSVPKLEQRSNSKNRITSANVYRTNSSKSSKSNSQEKKLQYKLEHKNLEILVCQLNYCRFMYFLIDNSSFLAITSLNRGRVSLVLFKHILKIIKQISDMKNNWFGFTNWEHFKKCPKYQQFTKSLKQFSQKYEKDYLSFLKKAEINVIKEINQKMPQFSTNDQLSISFFRKILTFLKPILKECLQNLSSSKGEDGVTRFEGLRSLYKYYKLIDLSIKQHQNFQNFANGSNITVLKNYRYSDITMNQYMQIKQEIKQI